MGEIGMINQAVSKIAADVEIDGGNTLLVSPTTAYNIQSPDKSDDCKDITGEYNLIIFSGLNSTVNDMAKVIWQNVSYTGYVLISDIDTPQLENRILSFLRSKEKYYFRKRRMMQNGKRENFLCFKIYNPNKRTAVVTNTLNSNKGNLKIACVMRKSRDYTVKDVNMLAKNVKKHLSLDYEFVALVDDAHGIDRTLVDRVVELKHNYPSWWCKLELFRPDVFEPDDRIIYFDLDTAIVDNIDFMFEQNEPFVGLRDFYNMFNFASGVLSWVGISGYHLAETFNKNYKKVISNTREGDQRFIAENTTKPKFWQDLYPGKMISFKKDMKEQNRTSIPEDAAVICFHGKPKLFDCGNVNILRAINS